MNVQSARAVLSGCWRLTKPRIATLSVACAAAGYLLAGSGSLDALRFGFSLLGIALLAGASGALNQYAERRVDAMMSRTRGRPLPSGLLRDRDALAFGAGLALVGLVLLALHAGLLTAGLGAATLAGYIFVYTPMKKTSWLSTWVGAVAGALPVVMGWSAAGNGLGWGAGALFLVLYLWQIPHFLAIAWMRREDYRAAGFTVLAVVDPEGRRMGRQLALHGVLLTAAGALPALTGVCGTFSLAFAIAAGLALTGFCVTLAVTRKQLHARLLLRATVIYLPLVLIVMVIDKAR